MAEINNIINLQECTILPVSVLQTTGNVFPSIKIDTPIGEMIINTKKIHTNRTSLFFVFRKTTTTQVEKTFPEIISEIREIENKVFADYINKWKALKVN